MKELNQLNQLIRLNKSRQRERVSPYLTQLTQLTDLTPTSAFTLIELLVVLSIIAVLTAIALPAIKTFRPNPAATGTRAVMDAVARARQLAISQRTSVFLVFIPTNFWLQPGGGQWPNWRQTDWLAHSNLIEKQLVGYNFLALRSAGDQPGQATPRYLSSWKALPEGAYIPMEKFSPGFPAASPNAAPNAFVTTNAVNSATMLRAFSIFGFHTNNNFPFPLDTTPPLIVNGRKTWTPLPYIGFNYLGQIVTNDFNTPTVVNTTLANEYIPIAKGGLLFSRDVNKNPLDLPPRIAETPYPNAWASNTFNIVSIDWLTGRARAVHLEVQ